MTKGLKKRTSSAARAQQRVQDEVDRREAEHGDDENNRAMQSGARHYPEPPFPAQHQKKPGQESALEPAPLYDAPYWQGSGKLRGKRALITGGDSGIGRAVAVLFAREGADVAICHLDEEGDDAFETCEAVALEGRRCVMMPADVRQFESCKDVVRRTVEEFGGLDILVNNAAFQYHRGGLEELSPEHFDLTIKTNLYGYFYMTKAALPHLGKGAAIVNTGSVTGIDGSSALLDYSMTKGGIHAFTRSLASSLVPRGIRVNCIAPGPVWTPLNPSDRPAEAVREFGSSTPMGRPAQPEEIAPAYVFFASAQCSSYITGEILPVIGGY